MPLTVDENIRFHERCRNIARELIALDEECARIVEYFTAEVQGEANFVATDIATLAELGDLKTVMDAYRLFMQGTQTSADAQRRTKLMPFMG